jgi:hypothetical protein
MCSHGEEDSMLFLGNHTLCLRCDHIRIKIVKERYEKFEEISGKKKIRWSIGSIRPFGIKSEHFIVRLMVFNATFNTISVISWW